MKKQYQNRSQVFNGPFAKPLKLMALVVLLIAAWGVFSSWVESQYPSSAYLELHYRHNVSARVFYDPYVGIPLIDTTGIQEMTEQQLSTVEYVDSVKWDVPQDNRQAQVYWAISLVHADPDNVDQFLASLFPEP